MRKPMEFIRIFDCRELHLLHDGPYLVQHTIKSGARRYLYFAVLRWFQQPGPIR